MIRSLFLALLFCWAASTGGAAQGPPAVFTRELGRGLLYHRIQDLPTDLPPSATTRKQPCVLDLRYARGDSAAASALQAWMKFYATPRTPVFVLVNAQTEPALLQSVGPRSGIGSVLVIGAAMAGFVPDIAVQTSPEAERRAYDALAAGVEPALLMAENPDKVRNDEASLSRDRSTEPIASQGNGANGATKPAAPPFDAALQRAVHLHRSLLALRRM